MNERFEKDGRPQLIDALKRQEFVAGNAKLADALITRGELVEFQKGDKIITEAGEDNDIYLLLTGSLAVVVKGNDINTRKAGQHVGEMAAIEPSLKRSATLVAHDTVVALKLKSVDFNSIGKSFRRFGYRLPEKYLGDFFSATILFAVQMNTRSCLSFLPRKSLTLLPIDPQPTMLTLRLLSASWPSSSRTPSFCGGMTDNSVTVSLSHSE